MKRAAVALLIALVVAVAAVRLRAYVRLGALAPDGSTVAVQWNGPIQYYISNVGVPGVSPTDLANAVSQAFKTWGAVAGVSFSTQFMGFTNAAPVTGDGLTVIGFESQPDLTMTLGQTSFAVDATTDKVVEADIFLNSSFSWSVSPTGQANDFDVQSIVTHECGHLLGLGHSALGETNLTPVGRVVIAKAAVMFPIAYPSGTVIDRNLQQDDKAGIETIYGTPAFDAGTGSISGRVTLNGQGLFGAHVIAANITTGLLTAGFALDSSGTFVISALPPGLYLLRAEPLDDADVTSFFSANTVLNLNFRVTYYPSLVSVPKGGAGQSFVLAVQPK